jgi:lysine-N-methylase
MQELTSIPRYLQSFSCNGPKCPDTCCSGWNVHLDEATHEAWQSVQWLGANQRLAAHLRSVRPEEQQGGGHPALIVRTAAGTCPLLADGGLCSVHTKLGEELLPLICHTYPRGIVRTGHETSMYLSLGCPEAARLALSDPSAMDMVPARGELHGRLPKLRQNMTLGLASPEELSNPALDAMQACHAVFAQSAQRLLRVPDLTVWQAWALYWQKAIEAWSALKKAPDRTSVSDKLAQLHQLAEHDDDLLPLARIAQSAFVDKLLPMPKRLVDTLAYAKDVGQKVRNKYKTPTPQTVTHAMALPHALESLGIHDGAGDDALEAAAEWYEHAHEAWFQPFDEAHPHLLRNYMLNRLALRNFPVTGTDRFAQELAHEAMDLDTLRVFLVGQAMAKRDKFGADDYVLLTQVFTRHVLHTADVTPGLST